MTFFLSNIASYTAFGTELGLTSLVNVHTLVTRMVVGFASGKILLKPDPSTNVLRGSAADSAHWLRQGE
jgi:hypothetical protein